MRAAWLTWRWMQKLQKICLHQTSLSLMQRAQVLTIASFHINTGDLRWPDPLLGPLAKIQ